MEFPLHSVSGPGSKKLLSDGIEPISNRLKTQQVATNPVLKKEGRKGGRKEGRKGGGREEGGRKEGSGEEERKGV